LRRRAPATLSEGLARLFSRNGRAIRPCELPRVACVKRRCEVLRRLRRRGSWSFIEEEARRALPELATTLAHRRSSEPTCPFLRTVRVQFAGRIAGECPHVARAKAGGNDMGRLDVFIRPRFCSARPVPTLSSDFEEVSP
jgi:hypothetical protein